MVHVELDEKTIQNVRYIKSVLYAGCLGDLLPKSRSNSEVVSIAVDLLKLLVNARY